MKKIGFSLVLITACFFALILHNVFTSIENQESHLERQVNTEQESLAAVPYLGELKP